MNGKAIVAIPASLYDRKVFRIGLVQKYARRDVVPCIWHGTAVNAERGLATVAAILKLLQRMILSQELGIGDVQISRDGQNFPPAASNDKFGDSRHAGEPHAATMKAEFKAKNGK